jgi:20S proteasome subunit beta 2
MSEFTNQNNNAPPTGNQETPSGFSFENIHRNTMIEQMAKNASAGGSAAPVGYLPQATKTGTTIVGIVYKGGVVLGADTRATGGTEVADKNCEKIHFLAPNIYCCGAGTAADTEKTTELISSQLELLRMNTGNSQSRVVTACTMLKRMLYRYQGYVSAALVLGGCDVNGPHVYQIYPHGSTGKLPYTTMGSGSLAAMSVFETGWTEGMSEEEGIELVKRAILAGVFNDLGSGSNVDTCVIRTDGTMTMNRGAVTPNDVKPFRDAINRSDKLNIRSGTTSVLKSTFTPAKIGGVSLSDVTVTEMET